MSSTAEKLQILYLEDDPQWRERIQDYLGDKYDVVTVGKVEDALELIEERPFALLLVDYRLVPLDGYDQQGLAFIKQLREIEAFYQKVGDRVSGTKVVLLSAYPWGESLRQQYRDYEIAGVLDKGNVSRKVLVDFIDKSATQPYPPKRVSISIEFSHHYGQPTLTAHGTIGEYGPASFRAPYERDVLEAILKLIGRRKDLTDEDIEKLRKVGLMTPALQPDQHLLRRIGETLFGALSIGKVELCLETAIKIKEFFEQRTPLDIELRFDNASVDFALFPWELIGKENRHLLKAGIARLSRYTVAEQVIKDLVIQLPVHVLVVAPRPRDVFPLQDSDVQALNSTIQESGQRDMVVIESLSPATLKELLDALDEGKYDVLHFDGHGELGYPSESGGMTTRFTKTETLLETRQSFVRRMIARSPLLWIKRTNGELAPSIASPPGPFPTGGVGSLAFEDAKGWKHSVSAHVLGEALANSEIKLVVLNACNSAAIQGTSVYNTVAPALISQGIPGVVGMQFPITSESARIFTEKFYGALVQSPIIDAEAVKRAVSKTRRALFSSDEWFYPTLYLRES